MLSLNIEKFNWEPVMEDKLSDLAHFLFHLEQEKKKFYFMTVRASENALIQMILNHTALEKTSFYDESEMHVVLAHLTSQSANLKNWIDNNSIRDLKQKIASVYTMRTQTQNT